MPKHSRPRAGGHPHRKAQARKRSDAGASRLERQHQRQVDRLAAGYNRTLQARVRRTHSALMRLLRSTVGRGRQDAEDAPLSAAERSALMLALAGFVGQWRREQAPDQEALRRLFQRTDKATTRATRRAVAKVVGGRGMRDFLLGLPAADPVLLRQDFVRANVALIKSIDTRYFADIRRVVEDAYTQGKSWRELTALLKERYDVSKGRAQLIARDQLGKLTSQISEVRHLELDIEAYEWLTSEDERVRESHERMAGQIVRYDNPPPFGHAGMDFQCRCGKRAVLSAQHAEQLRTEARERLRRTTQRLPRSPIVTGEIMPIPSRRISAQRVEQFRGEFRRVA